MAIGSDNVFPKVKFSEETAPATPSAGEAVIYVKSDGKLYLKDDAGTETDLTATGGGSATFAGARVFDASTQSVATGTWTSIEMDSERFDTDAYHDTATNNSRITIPVGKAGKYQLGGTLGWAGGSSTGRRGVRLFLNGTTGIAEVLYSGVDTNAQTLNVNTVYDLAEGDFIELQGFQSSGGALSTVQTANSTPEFWAALIGT